MPSPPNQPNVLRVQHFFTIAEDLAAQVRIYIRYTGGAPSNADLNTYAGTLFGMWPGALASLMTPDKSLTSIVVTDLTSPTAAIGSHVATAVGSLIEPELPAATCTMTNHHIHRRYRGGKPRAYWPFGSQTRLADEQTWTAGWIALVETEILAYFNGSVGIVVGPAVTAAWVNISQYLDFLTVGPDSRGRFHYPPKPRPVAIAPDDIGPISVHPRPTNQRRRALNR